MTLQGWVNRRDFPMPYQDSCPFPKQAIVQIKNAYGDIRIGPASSFWWGWEQECHQVGEGVIISARRLDREKQA
jgi:hypothetical protein